MKNKIIFSILSVLLISSVSGISFAFNLQNELNKVAKVTGKGEKGLGKSLKGISSIDKKIEKAIGSVKGDVLKKVEGEINKVKEKIDDETAKIKKIIKEAEDGINKFKEIKANAEKYIRIAKIAIGFLSGGIVILIFFLWRVWRNIVGFKKIVKNVANYDAIKKQIKDLEKKVAKLDKATHSH
jgi:archaellum component FlaC